MPNIAVGQPIDLSMALVLFLREENVYASDNISIFVSGKNLFS